MLMTVLVPSTLRSMLPSRSLSKLVSLLSNFCQQTPRLIYTGLPELYPRSIAQLDSVTDEHLGLFEPQDITQKPSLEFFCKNLEPWNEPFKGTDTKDTQ